MDEGRKHVLLIAPAMLTARKLATALMSVNVWLLKNSLPEKCSEELCVRKPY